MNEVYVQSIKIEEMSSIRKDLLKITLGELRKRTLGIVLPFVVNIHIKTKLVTDISNIYWYFTAVHTNPDHKKIRIFVCDHKIVLRTIFDQIVLNDT